MDREEDSSYMLVFSCQELECPNVAGNLLLGRSVPFDLAGTGECQ